MRGKLSDEEPQMETTSGSKLATSEPARQAEVQQTEELPGPPCHFA